MATKIDFHHDPARRRHRTQRHAAAWGEDAGKRADDAITNLSAYALKLDFEYHRQQTRLLELVRGEAAAADDLRTALRERDELGAARDAFRQSVAALQDLARGDGPPG
jgi:hypothetical protein